MPIHRLLEEPGCRGILADITCDSDGKIDRFIGGLKNLSPCWSCTRTPGMNISWACSLWGRTRRSWAILHNLLGDTNAVHVTVGDDGEAVIDEVVEGDTVAEVLSYVQFTPEELRRNFRRTVEAAVRDRKLSLEESRVLRRFYEQGLSGYTYLT